MKSMPKRWNLIEPFIEEFYLKGATFQQDSAPARTSKHNREYLMKAEIVDIEWAPKSPNMDGVEHLWALLMLWIYHGDCQVDTVKDLKQMCSRN